MRKNKLTSCCRENCFDSAGRRETSIYWHRKTVRPEVRRSSLSHGRPDSSLLQFSVVSRSAFPKAALSSKYCLALATTCLSNATSSGSTSSTFNSSRIRFSSNSPYSWPIAVLRNADVSVETLRKDRETCIFLPSATTRRWYTLCPSSEETHKGLPTTSNMDMLMFFSIGKSTGNKTVSLVPDLLSFPLLPFYRRF